MSAEEKVERKRPQRHLKPFYLFFFGRVRLVPLLRASGERQVGGVPDAGHESAQRSRFYAHRRVQLLRHGRPVRALLLSGGLRQVGRKYPKKKNGYIERLFLFFLF